MAGITHISIIVLIVMISTISFASGNKPVLACYLHDIGSKRLKDFDPTLCTHIVYYGMNITFDEVVMSETMEQTYSNVMKKFNEWKILSPSLKILISVHFDIKKKGEFESLIDDTKIHSPFTIALIEFLNKNDLDGLNLRYNYLTRVNPNRNLKQFLELFSLRMKLNKKILTTTILSCDGVLEEKDIKYSGKYFRFMFVMCDDYDRDYMDVLIKGLSIEEINFTSVNKIIEGLMNIRLNYSSLVLGIELQAHVYKIDRVLKESTKTLEPYDNVCHILKNYEATQRFLFDTKRFCLMASSDDGRNMTEIYYNSPRNMESKITFALHHKIAGVMVWPLNADDVFNRCDEKYNIFNTSVNFPSLRSVRKYFDEILTKSWNREFTLTSTIDGSGTNNNKINYDIDYDKETDDDSSSADQRTSENNHDISKMENSKGSANRLCFFTIGASVASILIAAIVVFI